MGSLKQPPGAPVRFLTCTNIGEIGHVNVRTKLEVYSITHFVDMFQSMALFIKVT